MGTYEIMAHSGIFRPRNIKKYRGDYRNIIYRSSWEKVFMRYCDKNSNILEWGSEETIIPYRSPLDQRIHRYFPDFYIKVRDNDGKAKKYIIEIKPKKQCIEPKIQKMSFSGKKKKRPCEERSSCPGGLGAKTAP